MPAPCDVLTKLRDPRDRKAMLAEIAALRDKLGSIPKAAEALGISERTLYRMLAMKLPKPEKPKPKRRRPPGTGKVRGRGARGGWVAR